MQLTRVLWQGRQPMIRFLGKRNIPKELDHTPHRHPSDPAKSLPNSFAAYRQEATQHGPLKSSAPQPQTSSSSTSSSAPSSNQTAAHFQAPYGNIGGRSAKELGSVQPKKGEFWDRSELPSRFHRHSWSAAEIEAIESGGASMFV